MPLLSLINFLGPKGIIAIIFVAIMAGEGALIYSYKNKVQSLKQDLEQEHEQVLKYDIVLKDLKGQLEEADAKNKKLQDALTFIEETNKRIRSENSQYKEKLLKLPMATNCVEAMTELKSQSAIIAGKWNKK